MAITKNSLKSFFICCFLSACSSHPPIPAAENVDLKRFMGDWYVIAHIPTSQDDDHYQGLENYAQDGDLKVQTTYTYREGSFDAKEETMKPVGFVSKEDSARWKMQFIWPLKFDYVISHLDQDYTQTIIARKKRDYAWIMARERTIPEDDYRELRAKLGNLGYDLSKLRQMPQVRE